MKSWVRKRLQGPARAAGVARAEVPAAPALHRVAMETWLGIAISLLALCVALASAKLSYDERDTPFRTLVYEREIGRAFDAIDFLQRQRYDLSVIETAFDVGQQDAAAAAKALATMTEGYGRIVSESWMYPAPVEARLTTAAVDFNHFAALCLTGRYTGAAKVPGVGHRRFVFDPRCSELFATHVASSNAAERALRDHVGFDAQRSAITDRVARERGER